ncbi:MAG: hypothetical protein PHO89_09330 [Methylacidiphilaceae bacterium]|nr:hypothetical protein [Candidatus Methylacidiphilaceae bacterium]
MREGRSADTNGKADRQTLPQPQTVAFDSSTDRLWRLAGLTMVGVSFLYLLLKALPAISAPSWWRAGTKELQWIQLRQEGEEILSRANTLDKEFATRTRLAPMVAAVAFSSVPSLLVDEVEILAPSSAQAGRVRIAIRSFDSDGMGAMATFGAMVGMALERSTGRKIRLNPTGLKIPYSLDRGDSHGAEPIRATLSAPLRWEDLR